MTYRLEPDLVNSRIMYIYQDTENATRCKMTIISDIDLAHRILGYLNTDVEFEPVAVNNNKSKKRKSKEVVVQI